MMQGAAHARGEAVAASLPARMMPPGRRRRMSD